MSPKTLEEVPLSVLESAKPDKTAATPPSLPYPASTEGLEESLQPPKSIWFKTAIQVGWKWVGKTGTALMGPAKPYKHQGSSLAASHNTLNSGHAWSGRREPRQ